MSTKTTPQKTLDGTLLFVKVEDRDVIRRALQPIVDAATFTAELEALPRYVWDKHDCIRNVHDLRHMLYWHKVQEQQFAAEMAAENEYNSWGR